MQPEIKSIEFPMDIGPISMGTVNCYLITTDTGYSLIDTGYPSKRAELDKALEDAGCRPGNLKLIILTHGDLDHIGNGPYLREKYHTKIAIHPLEARTVETGDPTLSRKQQSALAKFVTGTVIKLMVFLSRFGTVEPFSADLCIEDGYDLSGDGLNAKVIGLPGHSRGSIGILTADGNLFCGDLLWNMGKPGPHSIVDDKASFNASLEKLMSLPIKMVYPGHGKPFTMEQLKV